MMRHYTQNYDRTKDAMHCTARRGVRMLQADGILPNEIFVDARSTTSKYHRISEWPTRSLRNVGTCYACAVRAKREVTVDELSVDPKYGGPEYETLAAIGSLCGVGDLKNWRSPITVQPVCTGHDSTGAVIAFASRLYEKVILTKAGHGRHSIRLWRPRPGSPDIPMMLGRRDGDCWQKEWLVPRASLGPEAGRINSPYTCAGRRSDARTTRQKGLALAYATSPTGADHMEAPHDPAVQGFFAGPTHSPRSA